MLRRLILAIGLTLTATAPLQAQVRLNLSPFAGAYVPTADVLNRIFDNQGQLIPLKIGHDPAILFGGRLGLRTGRVGIEASAAYTPSNLDIIEGLPKQDGSVFLGSLDVLYAIFQAPFTPVSIYVIGGGAVVSHGGDFYSRFDGTSDLAGNVGFGARFGLGPVVGLRFDVRDFIYSFQPRLGLDRELASVRLDSRLQNDLVATLGLDLSFSPAP